MRNATCARTETSKLRRKWPFYMDLYSMIEGVPKNSKTIEITNNNLIVRI